MNMFNNLQNNQMNLNYMNNNLNFNNFPQKNQFNLMNNNNTNDFSNFQNQNLIFDNMFYESKFK